MNSRPSRAVTFKGTQCYALLLTLAALTAFGGPSIADDAGQTAPAEQDSTAAPVSTPAATGIPSSPSQFVVKPITISRMGLTWKPAGYSADGTAPAAPTPQIDGYHVEESIDGKTFTKVTDVASDAIFYDVNDLKPATPYWFRIGAYNGQGVTYSPSIPAATIGEGAGLTGHYYTWTGLQNPVYPKYDRVDPYIDFDWIQLAQQDPNVDPHNFMVVWTGQIQPLYTETYTFIVNSDDGDRLWVDGKKLIDHWVEHAAADDTATIDLVAGKKYDIRLGYFENDNGPASVRFSWSSQSQPLQVVLPCQLYAKTSTELAAAAEDNQKPSKPKPAVHRLAHRKLQGQ